MNIAGEDEIGSLLVLIKQTFTSGYACSPSSSFGLKGYCIKLASATQRSTNISPQLQCKFTSSSVPKIESTFSHSHMGRPISCSPPQQTFSECIPSSSSLRLTTLTATQESECVYPASRWPNPFNPWHKSNKNPRNPLNRHDHGFNRLFIQLPQSTQPTSDNSSPPQIKDEAIHAAYIETAIQKLNLAKLFAEASRDSELVDKHSITRSLAQGPLAIDFHAQALIRLIVQGRHQLEELHHTGGNEYDIQTYCMTILCGGPKCGCACRCKFLGKVRRLGPI